MLSAIILTKNEEKNIVDCIESLSFCDEVIIVDDKSDDRTIDLAKRAGVKVFTRDLNGDFAAQRNFGLEKAQGEWVLSIDADERVPEALASEISNFVFHQKIRDREQFQISIETNGVYIKRIDYMWGKGLKFGETGNMRLLRLAKKDAGRWEGRVHEEWKIKGKTATLTSPLDHFPHQTISEFLDEINFYTDIRANELYEKGVRVTGWEIIAYPKVKFFVTYFLLRGFRDGIPGLLVSLLMSFHSFLVRGKLWLLARQSATKSTNVPKN